MMLLGLRILLGALGCAVAVMGTVAMMGGQDSAWVATVCGLAMMIMALAARSE